MDKAYRSAVSGELVLFWLQRSVEALAQFVGRPLRWQTDDARRQGTAPPDSPGGPDQVVVYVQSPEPVFRLWAVGWPGPTAVQVLRWLLVPDDSLVLDRPAPASALLEAGNVMAGTFFTAVAGFMNQVLIPSPPDLFVGDPGACQTHLRDLVAHEAGTWFTLVGRFVGEGLELPQWTAVFLEEGGVGP